MSADNMDIDLSSTASEIEQEQAGTTENRELEVNPSEGFEDISKGKGKLFKKIIKPGQGTATPQKGCEVSVHYVGTLKSNGNKFDSSRDRDEPFEFTLGERSVIKGWEVGVLTMTKGEVAVFEMAPEYGYGASGSGANIPPNAWLVFEIELLDWALPDISKKKDKSLLMKVLKKGTGYSTPSDGTKCKVNYQLYSRTRVSSVSNEDDHELIEKRDHFEFVMGDEHVASFIETCAKKMEKGVEAVFYHYSDIPITADSLKYSVHTNKEKELFEQAHDKCIELHLEMLEFEEREREWQMDADKKLQVATQMKDEGNEFFKAQRVDMAFKRYERGLEMLSSDRKFSEEQKTQAKSLKINLLNNLAIVEFKRNNYKEVINRCNKVLEIQGQNVKALFKRAQAHSGHGDHDLAVDDLKKALEYEPENTTVQQELVRVQQKLKALHQRQKEMYSRMFRV